MSMSLKRGSFAPLFVIGVGAAASVAFGPMAAADPAWPTPGNESAADTISDLEALGYNVQINWVGGYSSVGLSRCSVNAIHNPERSGEDQPNENITVYVDVSCPPEHD
jgi:hypothetical protein